MNLPDVAIVDYGMGNLRSVCRALQRVAPTARVEVTHAAATLANARRVVVPGQGAMPDCMRELSTSGLLDAVLRAAAEKPFLGICVGLQMLFDSSEEGDTAGLGLIRGQVRRFPLTLAAQGLKTPHMGWNTVEQTQAHPLWRGIDDGARFYFVHSYYAAPTQPALTAGQTTHGLAFTSAIARANIFATQFHPEKSAQDGLCLLTNFMQWSP